MSYAFERDSRIPALSWLFRLSSSGAFLVCGDSVEIAPSAFFEGAWEGSFPARDFHHSANVFGSGAVRTMQGWVLVPPSHTLEAIYALKTDSGWIASNSLAFLLSATGADLDLRSTSALLPFIDVVNGIDGSPRRVATSKGTLHLLHHHNAVLGDEMRLLPKKVSRDCADFASYRDGLDAVLTSVAANASDCGRRAQYRLLATVSSGYDSPACAAIARRAGCEEGFTYVQSRDGRDDDGSAVGRLLGLHMTSMRHPLFSGASMEPTLAAEFFATGMQGEDITYAALSGRLQDRILVTGFYGANVWPKRQDSPIPQLKRDDLSGSSLGEFRLRERFIHLPLPVIGALSQTSMLAVCSSPEMQRYAIGGNYDRPVPRRIAEEAGVPRAMFGQGKRAVSTLVFFSAEDLPAVVREAVGRDLRAQPPPARLRYRLRSALYSVGMHAPHYGNAIARRLPAAVGQAFLKVWTLVVRSIRRRPFAMFEHMHPVSAHVLAWSLGVVALRYQTAGIGCSEPEDGRGTTP